MTHYAYRVPAQPSAVEQLRRPVLRVYGAGVPLRDGVVWKRVADVVLSIVALVLLSPVMLAAAVAIRVTSPGPILFRQERIGINRRRGERRRARVPVRADRRRGDRRVLSNPGRPFTIYKFRTMVADAEAEGKPMWARSGDPRITPVGRFLRRTRIDELPQFFNVLRGDMSIVGPRPERAYFIRRIEQRLPEFHERLRTRPGITGLDQVKIGYTNTEEGLREKLRYDLEYIRRFGPLRDLSILLRTVGVVITGKGAC